MSINICIYRKFPQPRSSIYRTKKPHFNICPQNIIHTSLLHISAVSLEKNSSSLAKQFPTFSIYKKNLRLLSHVKSCTFLYLIKGQWHGIHMDALTPTNCRSIAHTINIHDSCFVLFSSNILFKRKIPKNLSLTYLYQLIREITFHYEN